jgi:hypothetical protein
MRLRARQAPEDLALRKAERHLAAAGIAEAPRLATWESPYNPAPV